MTVDQQFTALTEKLQQLLQRHHRLQREADKLREELELSKKRELSLQGKWKNCSNR